MSPEDNPRIRVPAPVVFLIVFLIGLPFRRFLPMRGNTTAGVALLALSIAIDLWGMWTMKRARTNILPHNPAHALVRSGPFRFSRNPLYVGMLIGYLSAVVWIGALPSLLLMPVALPYLAWVVRREEAYLSRRFGDDYQSYRREVRRWL